MPLLAVGLNHTTAPLQIRERVVFAPEHLNAVLQELVSLPQVSEAAILSTCNRTELVCSIDDSSNYNLLIEWLGRYHNFPSGEISTYIYCYPDQEAVQHLLRVASGLDSMILGEPQILGQIKDAYISAKEAGTVGRLLSKLFEPNRYAQTQPLEPIQFQLPLQRSVWPSKSSVQLQNILPCSSVLETLLSLLPVIYRKTASST